MILDRRGNKLQLNCLVEAYDNSDLFVFVQACCWPVTWSSRPG